ncbi:uncharacterized transposon-derived [Paramuricea clavata]|uniref:Uncharacterized transposon-derived n=1 Tax=Paramuricea clavata TaxID=317549 RepID=A0A6S7FKV7_PARCT|nr:uncharacterized transposon-derived [Paramuricea clavata]
MEKFIEMQKTWSMIQYEKELERLHKRADVFLCYYWMGDNVYFEKPLIQRQFDAILDVIEKRYSAEINTVITEKTLDLNNLSGYNNQYRYLLVCIDVGTRYAFVKPLKTKTAKNVAAKFEEIILENGAPKKIQADEGTEFNNIKKILAPKYNFTLFHTQNRDIKAAHAERFIETIKDMIQRTLTMQSSYRFIKYLRIIVERYNEAPHRGIHNVTPVDLYKNEKMPAFLKFKILKNYLSGSQPPTSLLRAGQTVCIARIKNSIFEKSSLRRWGREIFIIDKVFITNPVTYRLKDKQNEKITGIFYREELQPI